MKNVKIFGCVFAIAVAMTAGSCVFGDNGNIKTPGSGTLVVRIDTDSPSNTRSLESPASTAAGTVELGGGHIFILTPRGVVSDNTPLNVDEATGDGQRFPRRVSTDSRVFVLGNIPSGAPAMSSLATLDAITNVPSAISTQTDYKKAVLASEQNTPVAIDTSTNPATAVVSIAPVISRLELVSLRGKSDISGFTVTGVYLDSYYPRFTFGGGQNGSLHNQSQSTSFSGVVGDSGTWPATRTGSSTLWSASPSAGRVWAYNVAPGGVPRLIIRMRNVKYQKQGATVDLGNTNFYLTVKSYSGLASTAFEPGMIYRIGRIEFGYENLAATPNSTDVDLDVSVDVREWGLAFPSVELF